MPDQSFPVAHRLLKRSQFRRVYDGGRRSATPTAVVFCLERGDAEPWRLGLTATRKTGKAVARNRLRRRAREFFRKRGPWLPAGIDLVVNLRRAALEATHPELVRDLRRGLGRLGIEVPEHVPGEADLAGRDTQTGA